jgi:hypothetical protein
MPFISRLATKPPLTGIKTMLTPVGPCRCGPYISGFHYSLSPSKTGACALFLDLIDTGSSRHVQIAAHPLRVLTTTDFDRSTVIACPLEIGGATLHHPLTLHYTGANQTDKCRRVWIIHFGAYGRLGVFHPRNLLTKLRTRVFHTAERVLQGVFQRLWPRQSNTRLEGPSGQRCGH